MLSDFFGWYMTSMAEFWGSAIRIGFPQILLVVLLICWLRRKGCGKSRGKSCCWIWSCSSCGDDSASDCCSAGDCGCTCGGCCCQTGHAGHDAEDAGDGDAHDG